MNRSLRNILTLCVTVLVCTIVMQATPLNLITNGTFSNNNLKTVAAEYANNGVKATGWNFSGGLWDGSGVLAIGANNWSYTTPPNGEKDIAFLQGSSYISQTLSLTKGATYTLTFYLTSRPGYNVDPVDVTIGGKLLGTKITLTKGQTWIKETETYTATSTGNQLLTLAGMNASGPTLIKANDFDAGLADFSMVVPEPAIALLLPFGLLFVSGLRKRFMA